MDTSTPQNPLEASLAKSRADQQLQILRDKGILSTTRRGV
ncbi:MAG: hypothetical protein ACOYU2_05295 [Nitrospirota bacterium]